MAGYKLQITDTTKNGVTLNFNVKYENLEKKKNKPTVVAKTQDGKVVKEKTIFQGQVLQQGMTERRYVTEEGEQYTKDELTFWCEMNGESVQTQPVTQTKVFQITTYEPLAKYTDHYIISAYYELSPATNDMKKDADKEIALNSNLQQMHTLWKYLYENKLIARAEFCVSSRGFIVSDGYIRAISIDGNKWTLELGVFKEAKIFTHMNEGEPVVREQTNQPEFAKVKMI